MFLTRLLYFAAFCVYGTVLPFLPLVLRERGLSDAQLCFVLGGLGVAAIIAPLALAHFADRHWQVRRLLRTQFALPQYFSQRPVQVRVELMCS